MSPVASLMSEGESGWESQDGVKAVNTEWCPLQLSVFQCPEYCEHVLLCGSRDLHGRVDFADVAKVRILWWGDFPKLSECVQQHHWAPWRWIRQESEEVVKMGNRDGMRSDPERHKSHGKLEALRSWKEKENRLCHGVPRENVGSLTSWFYELWPIA